MYTPANDGKSGTVRRSGPNWILIRSDQEQEKKMDQSYLRVGMRRWIDLPADSHIKRFKDRYKGKAAYIVGKGPSLTKLTKKAFETGCPVFAVNEAFTTLDKLGLESLIGVQQDNGPGQCLKSSSGAFGLVGPNAWSLYKGVGNVGLINPGMFNLAVNSLTALLALHLAKYFGCEEYRMYAFDAVTNGNCEYAPGIKDNTNLPPRRFIRFGAILRKFSPEVQFLEYLGDNDTTPQLPTHPTEHHEPSEEEPHNGGTLFQV
jgi:hypothetical protein